MKFIQASDIHFKNKEPFGKFSAELGMNTRTAKKLQILNDFFQYGIDNDVDFVVFAGDLFDVPNPASELRKEVAKVFGKYATQLPVIFVCGNHDYLGEVGVFESEGIIAGNVLKDLKTPGFYYINEPVVVGDILFVSYAHHERISEFISNDKFQTPAICISHFFASGATIGRTNKPVIIKGQGYPSDTLKAFKKVLLGDIHTAQEIGNIMYPGCLARIDVGDATRNPGFFMVDYQFNNLTEYITEINVEFIQVSDWTIERQTTGPNAYFDEKECCTDADVWEVTFTGTKAELLTAPYALYKDYAKHHCEKLFIKREQVVDEAAAVDEVIGAVDITGNLTTRWRAYCEQQKIPDTQMELGAILLTEGEACIE